MRAECFILKHYLSGVLQILESSSQIWSESNSLHTFIHNRFLGGVIILTVSVWGEFHFKKKKKEGRSIFAKEEKNSQVYFFLLPSQNHVSG